MRGNVLPKMPSEYARRHVFMGASFLSPALAEQAFREGFVDNVLWGRDYPHIEGAFQVAPKGAEPITHLSLRNSLSRVPKPAALAMAGENAVRAFGLDRAKLVAVAARINAPTVDTLLTPPKTLPTIADRSNAFRGQAGARPLESSCVMTARSFGLGGDHRRRRIANPGRGGGGRRLRGHLVTPAMYFEHARRVRVTTISASCFARAASRRRDRSIDPCASRLARTPASVARASVRHSNTDRTTHFAPPKHFAPNRSHRALHGRSPLAARPLIDAISAIGASAAERVEDPSVSSCRGRHFANLSDAAEIVPASRRRTWRSCSTHGILLPPAGQPGTERVAPRHHRAVQVATRARRVGTSSTRRARPTVPGRARFPFASLSQSRGVTTRCRGRHRGLQSRVDRSRPLDRAMAGRRMCGALG